MRWREREGRNCGEKGRPKPRGLSEQVRKRKEKRERTVQKTKGKERGQIRLPRENAEGEQKGGEEKNKEERASGGEIEEKVKG